MRIITWNVRKENKSITSLVHKALSYNPDILCLQEAPISVHKMLSQHGFLTQCIDIETDHKGSHGYTITMTTTIPIGSKVYCYDSEPNPSILNKVVYQRLFQSRELKFALITELPHCVVINLRLSCAVGSYRRVAQLKRVLSLLGKSKPVLVCGDFNTSDNGLFNMFTGWARGYTIKDYYSDERTQFEELFLHHDLQNLFRGMNTSSVPGIPLQLDHILVPTSMPVAYANVVSEREGSDHHMLMCDVGC